MTTALDFPARVIRDALTPIPPGREVTVDHLRPAFEVGALGKAGGWVR